MGALDLIREKFPSLSWLVNHPEIGPLLQQAVNPNTGFSPETFQAKLYQTNWFRSQSQTQREWAIRSAVDPGQAREESNNYNADLVTVAEGLGLRLTTAEQKYFTAIAMSRGMAANSNAMMGELIKFGRKNKRLGAGSYQRAGHQVTNIAKGQFLVNPSRSEVDRWATQIALGRNTVEDYMAAKARQTADRFPHMREMIASGMSVAEIAKPVIDAYAREMDWDANGLLAKMHTNPAFSGLLGIRDPKSKKMRMPTEHEAMTMARSRADWWGTTTGRQSDASLSQALLTMFGQRK